VGRSLKKASQFSVSNSSLAGHIRKDGFRWSRPDEGFRASAIGLTITLFRKHYTSASNSEESLYETFGGSLSR
jgi:hypothetical protein